jgi:hypothetical protein
MEKKIKSLFYSLALGFLIILPQLALAQSANNTKSIGLLERLQSVAGSGGYQTDTNIASTPKIIGTVVGAFVGFLGITFIILIIIAGYGWMTAGGNEEAIKKSKGTIKQAVIGLVIAISAYTIWSFIFQRIILLSD